jgi:hypothetical protein
MEKEIRRKVGFLFYFSFVSPLRFFMVLGCLLAESLWHFCSMGLDLLKGTVRNNLEAGVIEPAMSKVKIIQVTILEMQMQ